MMHETLTLELKEAKNRMEKDSIWNTYCRIAVNKLKPGDPVFFQLKPFVWVEKKIQYIGIDLGRCNVLFQDEPLTNFNFSIIPRKRSEGSECSTPWFPIIHSPEFT